MVFLMLNVKQRSYNKNAIPIIFRFRYSFICQGTSTGRQQSDLFALCVKLSPVTTSLILEGRGNPVKCLAQRHNKRTYRPVFTLSLIMLNAKHGSYINTNF